MAARILGLKLNLQIPSTSNKLFTLREVLSAYLGLDEKEEGAIDPQLLGAGLEDILTEIEVLRPERLGFRNDDQNSDKDEIQIGLTMEEMVQASGLSSDAFREVFLSWVDGESTPK